MKFSFASLASISAITIVLAIALGTEPASGGFAVNDGSYSIAVAVNVESDPDGHHEFIEMPDNIKLTVTVTNGGSGVTVSGPPPWVTVAGGIPGLGGGFDLFASGTVVGISDVSVGFQGVIDPGNTSGNPLTGLYSMGLEPVGKGDHTLPGGEPIVYRIKSKPGGSIARTLTPTASPVTPTPTACPAGAAGCPPLQIDTPTPTGTPEPGTAPPTATSGPITTKPTPDVSKVQVEKIDADRSARPGDITARLSGWEMRIFNGDGCTGSARASGLTPESVPDHFRYYSVLLPPGDYSVAEVQQPGWERISTTAFCQNFAVPVGGDTISIIFTNRKIRNGDVNEDGVTNSIDAALTLQYIAGIVSDLPGIVRADVDTDGVINAVDTALILQFDAGLLNSLPLDEFGRS